MAEQKFVTALTPSLVLSHVARVLGGGASAGQHIRVDLESWRMGLPAPLKPASILIDAAVVHIVITQLVEESQPEDDALLPQLTAHQLELYFDAFAVADRCSSAAYNLTSTTCMRCFSTLLACTSLMSHDLRAYVPRALSHRALTRAAGALHCTLLAQIFAYTPAHKHLLTCGCGTCILLLAVPSHALMQRCTELSFTNVQLRAEVAASCVAFATAASSAAIAA